METNETKGMSISANSPINKEMFNKLATKAECKIICDYICGCYEPIQSVKRFFIVYLGELFDGHIKDFNYRKLQVIADLKRQTIIIKIQNPDCQSITFTFYKSGAYYMSKTFSLPSPIQDIIVSWGTGIIQNWKGPNIRITI